MTLGAMVCGRPTYVVRAIIPGNLAEKPDPTHSTVSSMSCFIVFIVGHFRIASGLFLKRGKVQNFYYENEFSFICKYYSFSYQMFFN